MANNPDYYRYVADKLKNHVASDTTDKSSSSASASAETTEIVTETNFSTEDSDAVNEETGDSSQEDYEYRQGNNWQDMFNYDDMERYMLRYQATSTNVCLLDDIKEYLVWWSNENGTLKEMHLNFSMPGKYLDLSFKNIAHDEKLYKKVRTHTLLRNRSIATFSAAFNNLSHVPYKTLTLMKDTLQYLTLKGNQFVSMIDSQIEAINRIINDGNWLNDTELNTKNNNNNNNNNNTNANIDAIKQLRPPPIIEKPHNNLFMDKIAGFFQNSKLFKKQEGEIAWATFPPMPQLIELDISHCRIEYVKADAFRNLTNLRRLFISSNKILNIPYDTFRHVPHLEYLDLSFTNVIDFGYQHTFPTLEAVFNLMYGLKIQQTTFKYLPELVYLDLSHTKLTRNSAMAFTHLGSKLRYLSLCYTLFPMVSNALFKNTDLVALDLSGNSFAAYNIFDDAFEGIGDTLLYLYFEQSNIRNLNWLKDLENLHVLGLSGNNINSLTSDTFGALKHLRVLDLSSNHVGNWYSRVFEGNQELKLLNLQDNNINIINLEMLRDFENLEYLSLGDNNFVCDCLLYELVNIGANNNKEAECSRNVLLGAQKFLAENSLKLVNTSKLLLNSLRSNYSASYFDAGLSHQIMNRYIPKLRQSYNNLRDFSATTNRYRFRIISSFYKGLDFGKTECSELVTPTPYNTLNNSTLTFQLLDYEDEHYWCFNETERVHFVQLNCHRAAFSDTIADQLDALTTYVVSSVCAFIGVTLLAVVIYLKRWHILYYYSSIKSAALVSTASKESADRINIMGEQDPHLIYDIFLSYCQNDREWVLQELLPNVEEDISICMHERDFQIGVTILDNIISCMDRSRALMLIVSSNFLLSHWCQFEMHLAQHRIFEASKDHLIIIFLEDIPRSKRPKNLQYLMEVKTYIKWPTAKGNKPVRPEERKLFWKRLKRSLENIGVNPAESRA